MILGIAVVALIGYRINGTDAVNAFFYPGTMGVLLMLVSYIVCNVGAIVFLYFRGERKVPMAEIVIPLIALAIIFYVLYQNTLADSLVYPYTVFPLVVAGWLVLGGADHRVRARPRHPHRRGARARGGDESTRARPLLPSEPPTLCGESRQAVLGDPALVDEADRHRVEEVQLLPAVLARDDRARRPRAGAGAS